MKTLKQIILADLLITGAVALLQTALPGFLSSLLAISESWLFFSGIFLIIYCVELGILLANEKLFERYVGLVMYINIGWAIACAAFLALNPSSPNGLGIAFVGVQIASVLLFATAQALATKALRQSSI